MDVAINSNLFNPSESASNKLYRDIIRECRKSRSYVEQLQNKAITLGSVYSLIRKLQDLHAKLEECYEWVDDDDYGVNYLKGFKSLIDPICKYMSALEEFSEYTNPWADDCGLKTLRELVNELHVLETACNILGQDKDDDYAKEQFINECRRALLSHLKKLPDALKRFETHGISSIQYSQKQSTKIYKNVSTIATLFALVSATAIPYIPRPDASDYRVSAINALWFASLVLSIGSATTSIVALTWRKAFKIVDATLMVQSVFFEIWFNSGYLLLLVASVVTFLIGVIILVFHTTPIPVGFIVLAVAVLCFFGLVESIFSYHKDYVTFEESRGISSSKKLSNSDGVDRREEDANQESQHDVDMVELSSISLLDSSSDSISSSRWQIILDRLCCCRRKASKHDIEQLYWYYKRTSAIQIDGPHEPSKFASRSTPGRALFSSQGDSSIRQGWELKNILTADINSVHHLSYSPSRTFLAVCYQEACSIYDATTEDYTHVLFLKHAGTQLTPKQVEWAPSSDYLVSRTNRSLKLWKVQLDAGVYRIIEEEHRGISSFNRTKINEINDVKWLSDSTILAIVDSKILYRISLRSENTEKEVISAASTQRKDTKSYRFVDSLDRPWDLKRMCIIPELDHILVIGTHKIKCLSGEGSVDRYISCIIAYDVKVDYKEVKSHSQRILQRTLLFQNVYDVSCVRDEKGGTRCTVSIGYFNKSPKIWGISYPATDGVAYMSGPNAIFAKDDDDVKAVRGCAFLTTFNRPRIWMFTKNNSLCFTPLLPDLHEVFCNQEREVSERQPKVLQVLSRYNVSENSVDIDGPLSISCNDWTGENNMRPEAVHIYIAVAGKRSHLAIWKVTRSKETGITASQDYETHQGTSEDRIITQGRKESGHKVGGESKNTANEGHGISQQENEEEDKDSRPSDSRVNHEDNEHGTDYTSQSDHREPNKGNNKLI